VQTTDDTDPAHAVGLFQAELDDPHCLPEAELATLLRDAPWRRLAVFGDSVAEGIGDPVPGYRDASWADRTAAALESAVGPIDYLNLGVRGLTAAEIRRTQLRSVQAFGPDLAVVSAGANDALRRALDPAALEGELEAIVGPLAAAGCLVVTFGFLDLSRVAEVPPAAREAMQGAIGRVNAVTRRVTERHDGVHVDFFNHPALDPSMFSADLIHPNRRGHAHIASDVVRALVSARATSRAHQGAAAPRPADS
jgi:lysophospholipase L1-like esterase